MAIVYRCEYCGRHLSYTEAFCPACGAPNPHYDPNGAPDGPLPEQPPFSGTPRTISELQAFCRSRNMPLEKMRFFIGRDEPSPRAFGIFRHGREITVYKNKSDGTRVIRYRGEDEAFAVNEIYQKLLEEHRNRAGGGTQTRRSQPARYASARRAPAKASLLRFLPIILILLGYLLFSVLPGRLNHRNDGYYRIGEDLFYRYGTSWFADSYGSGDGWYQVDSFPYDDAGNYYQGNSYDDSWGSSDFTDSSAWDSLQDSDSSDSSYDWDDADYDDWDSGDTDWDSDW